MADFFMNVDACRPADTAKFARRVDTMLAMNVDGCRISGANSDYGPTSTSFDTTGVDAWVDAWAPTGKKCHVVINQSWNYNHASYIAICGTYGIDFPSYNRPPISLLNTLVSRDSSFWNRFATRWVQKGGRIEDLKCQIGGELGMGPGIAGPRESATRALIEAAGFNGRFDNNDDWNDFLDFPGATGIVGWLESYVPLMDWSGTKVIAPSIMGHLTNSTQIATDFSAAALGLTKVTNIWPYLSGMDQSQVADTMYAEITGAADGIFNGVLRYEGVPWWEGIPEGDLEWAMEVYPDSTISLAPHISNEAIRRLFRNATVQRVAAIRAAIQAATVNESISGAGYNTNLNPNAPIHCVEFSLPRGKFTGVDIYTNPSRRMSEVQYGNMAGAVVRTVCALDCIESAAYYDLENRASDYDSESGYSDSFGLMKSTGELSYAAACISGVMGGTLDVDADSPSGSWFSSAGDDDRPIVASV